MFTGVSYARSGDVNIAYQVVSDGPIDLVLTFGWVSHLAFVWELPAMARFLDGLEIPTATICGTQPPRWLHKYNHLTDSVNPRLSAPLRPAERSRG